MLSGAYLFEVIKSSKKRSTIDPMLLNFLQVKLIKIANSFEGVFLISDNCQFDLFAFLYSTHYDETSLQSVHIIEFVFFMKFFYIFFFEKIIPEPNQNIEVVKIVAFVVRQLHQRIEPPEKVFNNLDSMFLFLNSFSH